MGFIFLEAAADFGPCGFFVSSVLGANGPAEFGGGGAGVGSAFFGRGSDDVFGDGGVVAGGEAGLEGFFGAAVFAGMEGEDGDAATGFEAGGVGAEEGVEGAELVVDGDTEGLEDAALGGGGVFAGGGGAGWGEEGADGVG